MKGEDISSHSVSDNAPTPKSINQEKKSNSEKIVNADNMENKHKPNKPKEKNFDFSKALE